MTVVAATAAAWAGVCGLLTAAVSSRSRAAGLLPRGVTAAPRQHGLRRVFATGVIAVACVLLVSLTLVGRSLRNVLDVDPGFDARGVLALPLVLHQPGRDRAAFLAALHGAVEARLAPGAVSVISELPLTHDGGRRFMRTVTTEPAREVVLREAGPGYFDVMRIPIVAGRAFDARDDASAPTRVVVSRSLAEQWFPGELPVGRSILLGTGPRAPRAEIVGVAGDVKHRSLDEEGFWPTVYASAWQDPSASMTLVVRSDRPIADVAALVREEGARLDRDVPVLAVRSMEEIATASPGLPARRVLTATFTAFALLAVVLGGLGLFGVVAHDVASRRTELALRVALGATPTWLAGSVLGQGAGIVVAGLLAGGVLSIWATRALSAFVFATGGFDPLNLGAVVLVLMTVGAVAVLPAARRAARTDPAGALRGE